MPHMAVKNAIMTAKLRNPTIGWGKMSYRLIAVNSSFCYPKTRKSAFPNLKQKE